MEQAFVVAEERREEVKRKRQEREEDERRRRESSDQRQEGEEELPDPDEELDIRLLDREEILTFLKEDCSEATDYEILCILIR